VDKPPNKTPRKDEKINVGERIIAINRGARQINPRNGLPNEKASPGSASGNRTADRIVKIKHTIFIEASLHERLIFLKTILKKQFSLDACWKFNILVQR
jgi:hypothetical protein